MSGDFKSKYLDTPPVADDIGIDPADVTCLTDAENVTEALQEICDRIANSASPGFTWGRSGSVIPGTWMQNDNVPSNIAGRTVGLEGASIKKIQMANGAVNTFTLDIYEHDGTTYTLLHTVTFSAVRAEEQDLNIAVTKGKQLAIQLGTGSADNLEVGLLLTGTYT